MSLPEQAVKTFSGGLNCTQAVLSVFCERFGLERQQALRLATGFGGGIGMGGDICGAVSGAIMALGLKYGICEPDKEAKARMYRLTGALKEEFSRRAGSILCRDLLGFDLSTAEGREKMKAPGSFDCCNDFVRIAAEITEEMLQ